MKDYKVIAESIKASGDYTGSILYDELMSKHTTFKIGGPVPVFFEPENIDSLLFLLLKFREEKINYFVLGGGSNIVFCDSRFDGVVLSLLKINKISLLDSSELKEDDVLVSVDSGVTMASFVNFCTNNGLTGAEPFAGLPGTVGGALFMNARCFNLSVSDLFVEAYYIDLKSYKEEQQLFNASDWDYKISPFQNKEKLILNATFKLKKAKCTIEDLQAENKKYIAERKSKGHFEYPSAGSVFRNNRDFGAPSGKIIDQCGLRGKQIGKAQIAPFHGNFIINLGGALQKDVKALVDFTVNEVKEKTGFSLQPEIIFVDK